MEPVTADVHASHLESYNTFCSLHNLPLDPTPDALSFYIVLMCYHILPRSVAPYLSSIRFHLQVHFSNIEEVHQSAIVTHTLAGMKKIRGNTPIKRKRPLCLDDLQQIAGALPNPCHDDLLFIAMTFAAFFRLVRLGELTWLDNISKFSAKKIPCRYTVPTPSSPSTCLNTNSSMATPLSYDLYLTLH